MGFAIASQFSTNLGAKCDYFAARIGFNRPRNHSRSSPRSGLITVEWGANILRL